MLQQMLGRLGALVLVTCGGLVTLGCSQSSDARGAAETAQDTGTLQLALTASAGGHLYRFSNFQVWLYPDYQYLQSSGDPGEQVLTTELRTGQHQAWLQSYSIERDDGTGTFAPVQATLISSYAVDFEVLNGSSTSISFQFETDGQIVTMGAGTLSVTADVNERPPVCEPLGSTCGEGAWCPPTGLTGAPLACRSAGATPLGESCASTNDCIANASCVDLGAGAVCAALCLSSSFGAPCDSGGTCNSVRSDYGICTP